MRRVGRVGLVLLVAGCILQPTEGGAFTGAEFYSGVITVVDARSGFPLGGARVEFLDERRSPFWKRETNRLGRVHFTMHLQPGEIPPDEFTAVVSKKRYARTRVLFDAEDFHLSAASDRVRSRKTVELRRGRGSETVDLRGVSADTRPSTPPLVPRLGVEGRARDPRGR